LGSEALVAVIIVDSTVTQWIPGRAHLKDSADHLQGLPVPIIPGMKYLVSSFLHLRLPWIKFLLPPLLGQPNAGAFDWIGNS
jgi:hypothetical protein